MNLVFAVSAKLETAVIIDSLTKEQELFKIKKNF